MSAAVVAELSILDNAPLLLFGHSLGGAVAYETARTLRRDVLGLFVSARIAPVHRVRTAIHRGTDEEFWAALDALGGTDREITGNPELREVLTPMMRADFEASEFYSVSRGDPRLTCPVVAYVGADDPIVPAGQVADWAELCVDFTFVEFPGDHFYLRARAGELIADMMGRVQLPQRG
jgi:surfactin synthase thioesterase subunit